MAKALNRFIKEDPTFRSRVDHETGQTLISGMGELHLDIYIERMRREFEADVEVGVPEVAYREAISKRADFNYTHKKQTGGAGQFGRVEGHMEPSESGEYEFVSEVKGGAIPTEYLPAVKSGFLDCLNKGPVLGVQVQGMRVVVVDGQDHPVDSSEKAFFSAAVGAFRQAYPKASPIILEPIMRVTVECPSEYQGNVMSSINQRRGIILSSAEDGVFTSVDAEVPLSEMFGYATTLRSMTQGKAEFTMEFAKYARVPESIADDLKKAAAEEKRGGKK
jgi:elongation factor G